MVIELILDFFFQKDCALFIVKMPEESFFSFKVCFVLW